MHWTQTRIVWTDQATSRLAGWDVGVMPLRDGVYERAKCAYKLLQYAASGLPAVGSPIGVNAGILDEMDGLAPSSVDEWYDERKTLHHGRPAPQRPPPNRRNEQRHQRPNPPTSQHGWLKPRRPNQKRRKTKRPKPQEPEQIQREEERHENRNPGKPKKNQPVSKPNR